MRASTVDHGDHAQVAPPELRSAVCLDVPIDDAQWAELMRGVRRRVFAKGAALVRPGTVARHVFFLERGIVRYFVPVGDGFVNLGFDCEGRFAADGESISTGAPSVRGIEALSDVVAWALPNAHLRALEARDDAWRRVRLAQLVRRQRHAAEKERRIRTRTPEERYADLVREGSYLARRVPLYHLASYLGIAAETLSRIRARS